MKATKIDITQKIINVESCPYHLFEKQVFDSLPCMIDEEDIPETMIETHTDRYEQIVFYNPYVGEKRIVYLLKKCDKELFNNIVKIEEDVIKRKILEAEQKARNEESIITIRDIKNLVWWKRLFNLF